MCYMIASYRKINKDEFFSYMKKKILQNQDRKFEVSSTELADRFSVQGPTIDYHLSRLVEQGQLVLLEERGKYNRKIYTLPKNIEVQNAKILYDDIEKIKKKHK